MGTLYYLVKTKKCEYFDLNKAMGGLFVTDRNFILKDTFDVSTLAIKIMEVVTGNSWKWEQPEEASTYSTELAAKLLEWAGEDEVRYMTDSVFDSYGDGMDGYIETGDRFNLKLVKPIEGEDDD